MSSASSTMKYWYAKQMSNMTPAQQEVHKQIMATKAKVAECQAKAKKMRCRAAKTSAGMKGALQMMQSASKPKSEAAVVSEVKKCWKMAECYEEEDSACDELAEYALCAKGETEEAAIDREEGEQGTRDFQMLLEDLKVEPRKESEVTAKFALFEAYLETVEKLRADLFSFWDECKEIVPDGPVRSDIVKRMIAIDDQQNTGLPDFSPVRWFVYDMTLKAQQNNSMMSQLLKSIETKLNMINETDQDCPFCLEDLNDAHPSHLLTCCHRVGAACWKVWTEVRGPSAPCPVCRHTDFLNFIGDEAHE
eukprot:TRINITY_DN42_c1_g1_i1.p1 TRINITY_DN42_c1_g1~~TRINITY_DN42_c1_g1_i1.p1  ORF type:complete len:322 (+),score=126.53 TRINITY_DN42_c1_g1_i1:50-967(+)